MPGLGQSNMRESMFSDGQSSDNSYGFDNPMGSPPNLDNWASLASPIKTSRGGGSSLPPTSPVFGFTGQQSHQRLSKQLTNGSQKASRQSQVVRTFSIKKTERAKTAGENRRPKTEAGREYLREKQIKKMEEGYDISCGNATVQAQWSRKIVSNAKDVLEDNRGWSNKSDAHEKRLMQEGRRDIQYVV